MTTLAGTGNPTFSGDGGPAINASLWTPSGVAVDAGGNVFISDSGNGRVRKINASGIITTVDGNGSFGFSGDGGPATSASLYSPLGVAVDSVGNLYIADNTNQRIRKVGASGTIATVAGNGIFGFSGDGGPATSAKLNGPTGVAVDAIGNVYIADKDNRLIRQVNGSGIITTVAGGGTPGTLGDGGPATSAYLSSPQGVAIDAAGSFYIGDIGSQRIRKVNSTGMIVTLAGGGAAGILGDGGLATTASLSGPEGVAVDVAGNVFIADQGNNRIREVVIGPSINSGGITNGAGFQPGTVVPGGILSIFGLNFASGSNSGSGVPLPINLDGVQVLINGLAAPLFYVGTNQVNAQAPFELVSGTQASVVVQTNGVPSPPQTVPIVGYQPGIFTLGGTYGNQGAILLAGTSELAMAVTPGIPSAPVHIGDYVSIFCTGLGLTDPPVSTNTVGPNPPASTKTPVGVIIGDSAEIASFAGLAPGFIGLYQVNVQIPQGVSPGNAIQVVLTQGSTQSNTATIAVQP
jgi:uncharacterized protein (TIGR03437 family)